MLLSTQLSARLRDFDRFTSVDCYDDETFHEAESVIKFSTVERVA